MRLRTVVSLVAAVAVAAGCSSSPSQPVGNAPNTAIDKSTPAVPAAKQLAWGQAGTVTGENGGQLKVTPIGILYHRGPYKGVNGPQNGWFVAVALKAEAVTQQDDFVSGADVAGWRWRGQGQTIWDGEGNALSTPWVGAVPEFGDPIEPGSPELGIETFDVPTKQSGRLLYINPDESIVSWELPAADTGTGLDQVRKRIKMFS